MELLIKGSPKEIAALALEMQRRPETIIVQSLQKLSPSELVHQFQNVQRRMHKVRQSDFATLKGIPVPKASTIEAEKIKEAKNVAPLHH